jgi:Electron transfer DM13
VTAEKSKFTHMKTKLLFLPLLLLLFSCEVDGDLTQNKISVVINQPELVLKYQGLFAPTSGIKGSGTVKIYLENNQYKLALENYTVSSGPDLKVYLSKSNMPTNFVNLGNLNASTVYSIPQSVDLKEYKFVLIHCQQYNHLFAVAELAKN